MCIFCKLKNNKKKLTKSKNAKKKNSCERILKKKTTTNQMLVLMVILFGSEYQASLKFTNYSSKKLRNLISNHSLSTHSKFLLMVKFHSPDKCHHKLPRIFPQRWFNGSALRNLLLRWENIFHFVLLKLFGRNFIIQFISDDSKFLEWRANLSK